MTTPPASRTARLLSELGLLLVAIIWGTNFVVVKWALDMFDPLGFNALRHLLASAFMLVVLRYSPGDVRPDRTDIPRIVRLGVVGHFVYQMAFVYGLERTRAGNASLMLALVPLFLLLLGASRGERRMVSWIGALLSLGGVGLVSGSALRLEGAETLLGDLILIGAAGIWAVYTVGAQPLIRRYGPIRTTAWTLWAGSVGLVVVGIPSLFTQDWGRVGAAGWAGVAYSSLFSIGISYLLWYRGVQTIGAARTGIFSNLAPVVALIAGAVTLGEQFTPYSILGAALVIVGVLLVRSGPTPAEGPAVAAETP